MKDKEVEELECQENGTGRVVGSRDLLGPKRTDMKVSASGLLGRIANGWEVDENMKCVLGEMLSEMQEMADTFYAGSTIIVDQFLQKYNLDRNRP